MHKAIQEFEAAQLKSGIPDFRPGDTVRVSVRIIEGDRQRVQDFQGVCIGRHGAGARETFTVRRVSYGIGMERIFPVHSPRLEKIQVVQHGKVRRAKLYYLRELRGKKARIQQIRRTSTRRLVEQETVPDQSVGGEPEVAATAATPAPASAE